MPKLALKVLANEFCIYRFPPGEPVPASVLASAVYWVGKTDEELSIVCDAAIELVGEKDTGWACLKVLGPLDLALTGVLAGIAAALAAAQISIFSLSTFDTDYILVKSAHLERAIVTLRAAGYAV